MLGDSKAFSGFSVDSIDTAKDFYGSTLGLRVSEDNGMLSSTSAAAPRYWCTRRRTTPRRASPC